MQEQMHERLIGYRLCSIHLRGVGSYWQTWQVTSDCRPPVKIWSMMQLQWFGCWLFSHCHLLSGHGSSIWTHTHREGKRRSDLESSTRFAAETPLPSLSHCRRKTEVRLPLTSSPERLILPLSDPDSAFTASAVRTCAPSMFKVFHRNCFILQNHVSMNEQLLHENRWHAITSLQVFFTRPGSRMYVYVYNPNSGNVWTFFKYE